jgi:hypothetical protein
MADAARLPLYDIYQVSWLDFNGIDVSLTKQGNRVVFEVPANDSTYQLLSEYESNPQVRLLDMIASLRRIRGRMLDLRDGNGRRKRETEHGRER